MILAKRCTFLSAGCYHPVWLVLHRPDCVKVLLEHGMSPDTAVTIYKSDKRPTLLHLYAVLDHKFAAAGAW